MNGEAGTAAHLREWALTLLVEQRKAALNRVELELDEADEMVRLQHAPRVPDD